MRIAVLTTGAALAALRESWEALWQRVPDAPPFLAPSWLLPWWECFGTGELCAAAAFAGEELRGLLPLYVQGEKLLPLGVGISDYFDVLSDAPAPAEVAAALLRAVLEAAPVPRCDLPELAPGAALGAVEAPPGWRRETWAGPPCPVLTLQPAPAIPPGMRRDVRQAEHRGARAGAVHRRRATVATLAADLAALIALHTARWTARGGPGVLADDAVRRFHAIAAPELLRDGLLRLEVLELGGQPASLVYALLSGAAIHLYLSAFDPARRHESPGTALLGAMLAEAAAEGRREAHFLRGGEAYKYAWGAEDRHNLGLGFRRA